MQVPEGVPNRRVQSQQLEGTEQTSSQKTVGEYRTDEFRVNCWRVSNRRVQSHLLESTKQTSSESTVGGYRTDEFRVNCWRVPNRRV